MTALEIKALRKRMGLGQEKFASQVGVSLMAVYFWENGRRKPSPLAVEKLRALYLKYPA